MITKAYQDFFEELEVNNHKEWFHANKSRYEEHVKEPFHAVVTELIPLFQEIDPEIPGDPKSIIMRINKDIRFSKDKTPYNLMMRANFTPGGRKSSNPGFYLGIGAGMIHVGGGLYHPAPKELKVIRQYLIDHKTSVREILTGKSFQKSFGEVKGEKSKRLDKAFIDAATELPLIYQKQFFYMRQMPLSEHLDQDLLNVLTPHLVGCREMHHLLKNAVASA